MSPKETNAKRGVSAARRGEASSGLWIQKAIKHPGALRAKAVSADAITKHGTINKDWIKRVSKYHTTEGEEARLALTLAKLRKRK